MDEIISTLIIVIAAGLSEFVWGNGVGIIVAVACSFLFLLRYMRGIKT